jgi:hypothetical protein
MAVMGASCGDDPRHLNSKTVATPYAPRGERVRVSSNGLRQWANGQAVADAADARHTRRMSDATRPAPSLFGTPREWAKDLATATVIGVFLGVIGPFGSFYGGALELRIPYWVANMWIGFVVLSTVVRFSMKAAMRLDLPVWFTLAIGVAVGSLPLGFLVGWFSALFWPGNHGRFSDFGVWYGQTLVVAEPCSFAYYFFGDRGWRRAVHDAQDQTACGPGDPQTAGDPPAEASTPKNGGPSFLNRLPSRIGQDLLCLQMEDHYVRAHTERGSDLILIPLKDAIAELGDVEGLQVHRSWWVARAAVVAPVANGRNLSLRLINGQEVPVSRASVAKLKLAGWIKD